MILLTDPTKSNIHSISYNILILIYFEKCNDTQDSNSIKVRENVEIADITSKLTSVIADPIDCRIEDIIYVNNDRNYDGTDSESIDSSAEFHENPLEPLKFFSKYIM